MASDFDPRFDPAFQRGFDGVSPRVAPESVVEPVETSRSRVAPVETASPARVEPTSRVEPVETPSPALPPTLRGNPFIPALWIVAAVFTVAGAASQYIATFISFSPTASSASVEYVLPSVLTTLAPWLFGAGLAAGVTTLAIHALRWRPSE